MYTKTIAFCAAVSAMLMACQPATQTTTTTHAQQVGVELKKIAQTQGASTVNIYLETQTSWVAGALNQPISIEGSFLIADNEYYSLENLKFFSIKADSTNTKKVINLYLD